MWLLHVVISRLLLIKNVFHSIKAIPHWSPDKIFFLNRQFSDIHFHFLSFWDSLLLSLVRRFIFLAKVTVFFFQNRFGYFAFIYRKDATILLFFFSGTLYHRLWHFRFSLFIYTVRDIFVWQNVQFSFVSCQKLACILST